MRNQIGAAFAALALSFSLGPCLAENSGSHQIEISGIVSPVCVLPSPEVSANSNASFTNGRLLTIQQLIDENTAFVRPSSVTLKYRNAMCNYNAIITIASEKGGLTRSDDADDQNGAFLKVIPFKVSGTWGPLTMPTLDTSAASAVSQPSGGANIGDLTLTIATEASSRPALEGSFNDTIVVKIGQVL